MARTPVANNPSTTELGSGTSAGGIPYGDVLAVIACDKDWSARSDGNGSNRRLV